MKIQKTFIGARLNKDLDERLLPQGEYPHAENVYIVNTDASDIGAIENVRGNSQLTHFDLSDAVTIGGIADSSNQKLYWMTTSEEKDMVVEYDVRNSVVTTVLESTAGTGVLNFDKNYLITGINKIINGDPAKDLLAWTDGINPPRIINIERAKTYGLDGFEEDDISVIKKPPRFAPKAQLTYTNSLLENNLENKFLSFSYRYKYLDGEYSALSSFTNYKFEPDKFNLDYQSMENDGMKNKFNAVNITFNTGSKRVTDIQVIFKESGKNALYVIDTFNKKKEMWGDNENRTFKFSNSKKYAYLPEIELYRTYDNVPHTADAQEFTGNRLMYGCYTEGYDMVNEYGENVKINSDISFSTKVLSGVDLPISLNINNREITFDFTNAPLKEGSKISFFLNMKEDTYNDGTFSGNYDYLMDRDYLSVSDLFNDFAFESFIKDILTSGFSQDYQANPPLNSNMDGVTGFNLVQNSPSTITIIAPAINYTIDTTPSDTVDNPANTHPEVSYWSFLSNSTGFVGTSSSATSLKTNRSYEAGIIYMDEYNRSSTVLTDTDNTIYIPQEYSVNQNRLVVNVNHRPPVWADRYKIVVKQDKGKYETIYSNFIYKDGLYAWFKLEGNNKDKVKEGDTLIIKADTTKVFNEILELKVLEIKNQPKNFLDSNLDYSGNPVEEQAGLYMKLKVDGFSLSAENNKVYKSSVSAGSVNESVPPSCYVDLFSYDDGGIIKDVVIPAGSTITLKFDSSFNYDAGWSSHKYNKSFLVLQEYMNFQDWYNDNIADISLLCEKDHDYKNGMVVVRGNVNGAGEFTSSSTGKLYLKVQGHETGGSRGRSGYVNADISMVTTKGFFIFETESEEYDSDIYYETEQTFEIVDGLHQGNIQNQSPDDAAILELDFFNCYVQGNGAESYQYKDSFNANQLNIDLRPATTSIEEYKRVFRYADITYSDPYNENNNINGLSVFNLAKANYKEDLDKTYGKIRKMHNNESDLLVLQEDKVQKVLYGKDLLMNADGTSNLTAVESVLGQHVPYMGNYGISNEPESFVFNGFYKYFTDSKRGAVLRLANDGLNEISASGMSQFFKTAFIESVDKKKIGGYDPYIDEYILAFSEDSVVKPVSMTCEGVFTKNDFSGDLSIEVDYDKFIGMSGVNYSTNGKPVSIKILYNNVVTNYGIAGNSMYNDELVALGYPEANLLETGVVTFNKALPMPTKAKILIKAILDGTDVEVSGLCPVTETGKVFMIVVSTDKFTNSPYHVRYKSVTGEYSSPFKTESDLLENGVTLFNENSGRKGDNYIPNNNSDIVVEVFSNVGETPIFKSGGKFGYFKSPDILDESVITTILDGMTEITKTEIVSPNGDKTYRGQFNVGEYENLYLIYQYTEPPFANNDSYTIGRGDTITKDLTLNDVNSSGLPLTVIIDTQPLYGTVTVNVDNTITYVHNGGTNSSDSFTYHVSNSEAISNVATVTINMTATPPNTSNIKIVKGASDLDGNTAYDIQVINEPFVGYIHLTGIKGPNMKFVSIEDSNNVILPINSSYPNGTTKHVFAPITLPVGTHASTLTISGVAVSSLDPAEAEAQVGFAYTNSLYDVITSVECILEIPAILLP